jgi:hypothetical protein
LRQGWKLIWPYAGLYLAQASPFWRIFRLPLVTRPRMWIDRRCTDSVGRAWPCWRWIREHERHTRRSCSGRSFNWPLMDLLGFALMLAVGGFRRRGQRRGRASARDTCRRRCNAVCFHGWRYIGALGACGSSVTARREHSTNFRNIPLHAGRPKKTCGSPRGPGCRASIRGRPWKQRHSLFGADGRQCCFGTRCDGQLWYAFLAVLCSSMQLCASNVATATVDSLTGTKVVPMTIQSTARR